MPSTRRPKIRIRDSAAMLNPPVIHPAGIRAFVNAGPWPHEADRHIAASLRRKAALQDLPITKYRDARRALPGRVEFPPTFVRSGRTSSEAPAASGFHSPWQPEGIARVKKDPRRLDRGENEDIRRIRLAEIARRQRTNALEDRIRERARLIRLVERSRNAAEPKKPPVGPLQIEATIERCRAWVASRKFPGTADHFAEMIVALADARNESDAPVDFERNEPRSKLLMTVSNRAHHKISTRLRKLRRENPGYPDHELLFYALAKDCEAKK